MFGREREEGKREGMGHDVERKREKWCSIHPVFPPTSSNVEGNPPGAAADVRHQRSAWSQKRSPSP